MVRTAPIIEPTKTSKFEISIKLDESNYSLWARLMRSMLQINNLLEVEPDGTPKVPTEVKEDVKVEHAIFSNCEKSILETIQLKNSAKEMWDYLYESNSGENRSRMLQGIKKLASIQYDKNDMNSNLLNLEKLVSQTETAAGSSTIEIKDLAIAVFLDALPDRYESTRSIIQVTASAADVDTATAFKDMKKALIDHEDRYKNRADHQKPGFAGISKEVCVHGRVVNTKSPC